MSDEIDAQDERDTPLMNAKINHIHDLVAAIPEGEPGICNHCEEGFTRLVRGKCGRCRDLLHLP